MIYALIIALFLGAVTSFPLGALGAYMINKAIEKGFWSGFIIAIASASLDLTYCFTSLVGIYLIVDIPWLRLGIQAVGLIFLTYVGYQMFFKKKDFKTFFSFLKIENHLNNNSKIFEDYFKDGIFVGLYYIFNPTLVAFWINISSVLHASVLKGYNVLFLLLFSFFVGLGGLLVSYVFLKVAVKFRNNVLSASIIKALMGGVYFLTLIIFAFYLLEGVLAFFA